MNFIIFDLNILPILVWVVGLFIFWYGIVLCWVSPMYYRSLRSRVLLEYFIFIILFLFKLKRDKNNIISQKKFYGNYNKILLFKSSDILLGGPKHLRKVIGLEVYQVHHHERYFFVHNSLVVKTAHYHPFAPYIVKYGDLFYLYVPNFTTKGWKATLISKKGGLSKDFPIFVNDNVTFVKLEDLPIIEQSISELNLTEKLEPITNSLNNDSEVMDRLNIFNNNKLDEKLGVGAGEFYNSDGVKDDLFEIRKTFFD